MRSATMNEYQPPSMALAPAEIADRRAVHGGCRSVHRNLERTLEPPRNSTVETSKVICHTSTVHAAWTISANRPLPFAPPLARGLSIRWRTDIVLCMAPLDRWEAARRAALDTGQHAVVAAARGPGQLIRLARKPPVEVRPVGKWEKRHLYPSTGVRLRARGVMVNGLRIDRVDVRTDQITLGPGSPIAVRTHTISARVRLTEADVNWWLSTANLPLRLRFTEAGIRARTGVAGVALGSIDVSVALERGVLRLAPQRVAVLGFGLSSAAMPATPLPLPPLPHAARLTSIVTAATTMTAILELPGGTWDAGPDGVRQLLRIARSRRVTIGTSPQAHIGTYGTSNNVHIPSQKRRPEATPPGGIS